LSRDEIEQYLIRLETETKKFKHELYKLSWYMRGGVGISDLLYILGFEDREVMYNVINENIEMTKESRMPLL